MRKRFSMCKLRNRMTQSDYELFKNSKTKRLK